MWRIADDIAVGNVFGIFWRIDSGRKFGPRVCVFIDSFDPDSRHGHAEAAEIARRIADALNAE
ncbi:MAG TPA: hypothetical protein VFJ93_07820 [Gaiellaceae bacterium]|nr:hypothetical protein [Gaiellaceae bacterium]